jgi:proline iminopeptidase
MRWSPLVVVVFTAILAACDGPSPTMLEASSRQPDAVPLRRPESSGTLPGADGVALHFQIRGAGPDTVLVLHGGPGLSASYLVDDFAPLESGRTLIYFDQRGAGASGLPDPSLLTADRMVADVEAVRQYFRLERLTLVGHSWGGALAALYTTQHPDRVARLLLLGPAPSTGAVTGLELQGLFGRFSASELTTLTALNEQLATVPDDRTPAACEQALGFLFARYQFDARSLASMHGRWCSGSAAAMRYGAFVTRDAVLASLGASFDVPGALAATLAGRQIPVLVAEGAASPFVRSARAFAEAVPAARFVLLERAGHFAWLDDPRAFFQVVGQFLQQTRDLAE